MKSTILRISQIAFLSLGVGLFSSGEFVLSQSLQKNSRKITNRVTLQQESSFSFILAQNFGESRYQQLIKADQFIKQGNLQKAARIQRQVKQDFSKSNLPSSAVNNIEKLEPAAAVYWQNAQEGFEQGLKSKVFVNLKKLTKENPEFAPGHLLLVKALEKYDRYEKAIDAIERATTLFPKNTELLDKQIAILEKQENWLRASIAARQFAISNPDHSKASKYRKIAENNEEKYRSSIKKEMVGLSIGNIAIGALTDNENNVNVAKLLLSGEAKTGNAFSKQMKEELDLISDKEKLEYVNKVGQKLANLMGRDEFEYEFFIVDTSTPNAFALPGGKIYITSGMLNLIDTEAELAGLLSHELAHTVLSHSYQQMATSAALEGTSSLIPLGNLFEKLATSEFSRDQEQEADLLGTRVLAKAGYAADGLHSLMLKLKQIRQVNTNNWFSSHPAPSKRVKYLENLITRSGYDRYAYEGVKAYSKVFGKPAQYNNSDS